jgi:hypothetical protein
VGAALEAAAILLALGLYYRTNWLYSAAVSRDGVAALQESEQLVSGASRSDEQADCRCRVTVTYQRTAQLSPTAS